MISTDSQNALLVGSSGLLGPLWYSALLDLGLRVITADAFDLQADFQLDLRQSSSIQNLSEKLPQIDVLVLNAGIDAKLSVTELNSEDKLFNLDQWTQFFQVNVIGQAQLIQSLIPNLRPNSTVIGIGSIYALVAPRIDVYNPPGMNSLFLKHPAYGASKAAYANLFRQYAIQYAGKISFNLLTLGVVDNAQPGHFRSSMPAQIPTRVFLDKDSLGKHLQSLILASDINFTGQNLVVDGGYTLW